MLALMQVGGTGDLHWVTMNGTHVPIGAGGEMKGAIGGKIKANMEKAKSGSGTKSKGFKYLNGNKGYGTGGGLPNGEITYIGPKHELIEGKAESSGKSKRPRPSKPKTAAQIRIKDGKASIKDFKGMSLEEQNKWFDEAPVGTRLIGVKYKTGPYKGEEVIVKKEEGYSMSSGTAIGTTSKRPETYWAVSGSKNRYFSPRKVANGEDKYYEM